MIRQRGMVGTGVLVGLLALAGTGRPDEATAVKAVEKVGGMVTRDDKQPGKPVVYVKLYDTKVTDERLKVLKELKSLQHLNLRRTEVSDAGLKVLKELKSLQTLVL